MPDITPVYYSVQLKDNY